MQGKPLEEAKRARPLSFSGLSGLTFSGLSFYQGCMKMVRQLRNTYEAAENRFCHRAADGTISVLSIYLGYSSFRYRVVCYSSVHYSSVSYSSVRYCSFCYRTVSYSSILFLVIAQSVIALSTHCYS